MEDDKEYDVFVANTRELLKLKHGRAFIWKILEECGLYSDTFTGNSMTYYMEGKRAIGLLVLQYLEDADPTAYARLLLEQQKEKEI